MAIRLKDGVSPDILRKYGFKQGKEFFGKERWCGDGSGYQYQGEWYHKFLLFNEETGEYASDVGGIAYTEEEFDIPMVQMSFRTTMNNDLYIDCAPSCTYHISGDELDIVADTIFELVRDGVVEKYIKE